LIDIDVLFFIIDVLIAKPTDESIRQFLEVQKGKPFSYADVGATRDSDEPDNYIVDHNRVRLGAGRSTFKRAVKAVRSWKMFVNSCNYSN